MLCPRSTRSLEYTVPGVHCPRNKLPPGQLAAERMGGQCRLPFFPQSVLHGLSIPTKIWLFGRMGDPSGGYPMKVWAATPWQTKKLLLGVRNNF